MRTTATRSMSLSLAAGLRKTAELLLEAAEQAERDAIENDAGGLYDTACFAGKELAYRVRHVTAVESRSCRMALRQREGTTC